MQNPFISLCCLAVTLAQAQPAALAQAPAPKLLVPGDTSQWKLVWSDEFDGPDPRLSGEVLEGGQTNPVNRILSAFFSALAVVASLVASALGGEGAEANRPILGAIRWDA